MNSVDSRVTNSALDRLKTRIPPFTYIPQVLANMLAMQYRADNILEYFQNDSFNRSKSTTLISHLLVMPSTTQIRTYRSKSVRHMKDDR